MDALEDVLNGKIEILSSNSRGLSSHGGVQSPFDKKNSMILKQSVNRSGSRGGFNKPPKLSYQQSATLPKASPMRSPFRKKRGFGDINDVHPDLRIIKERL